MVVSTDEAALHAQIRKLSVKRITSPLVYDNLKNAVPNGLYDAAMGPMETHDRCAAPAHTYASVYDLLRPGSPRWPAHVCNAARSGHDISPYHAQSPWVMCHSCATCGLRYQHCPGHFGHVELAVPVFNPLVFP
jgi:DNA-directed RNA polymerase I subunit RPA1